MMLPFQGLAIDREAQNVRKKWTFPDKAKRKTNSHTNDSQWSRAFGRDKKKWRVGSRPKSRCFFLLFKCIGRRKGTTHNPKWPSVGHLEGSWETRVALIHLFIHHPFVSFRFLRWFLLLRVFLVLFFPQTEAMKKVSTGLKSAKEKKSVTLFLSVSHLSFQTLDNISTKVPPKTCF